MNGQEAFFRELQRFDIDINKNVLTYNGFHSPRLYRVYLQNLYLKFNTDLYTYLHSIQDKTERIAYLKKLKAHLTDLDDYLLQTREMFVLLESLLADPAINNYTSIIPRLKEMHVRINTEGALQKELEEINILAFIDSQISYSYKAISLIYNMITLELGAPSEYGDESVSTYKLRWKGSMRQLAELFVELQQKGWIAPIEDSSMEDAARSILHLFDIRRTRMAEDEKEYTSFTDILRGSLNKKGVRQYQLLYTPDYKPVFSRIPHQQKLLPRKSKPAKHTRSG
ncbi:MAG: hypothetical protein KatS3mg031_1827 [Chitinophagales bacterium]|nr:MAG: hypothetical protein KatS3mg031_1827 [Chitinophagales bacterium]